MDTINLCILYVLYQHFYDMYHIRFRLHVYAGTFMLGRGRGCDDKTARQDSCEARDHINICKCQTMGYF